MSFIQTLLTEVFAALLSSAVATSYIEFIVNFIRAPKRISDD